MKDKIVFSATHCFTTEILLDTAEQYFDNEAFFIVDSYFKEKLTDITEDRLFWLTATEQNKKLETVEKILSLMTNIHISRNDTVIAIGGGITLDVAAFCASIYKRGCRLILIPTTIIAMIDAAIGGKTGVNSQNKNQIGTFYPAQKVVLDFSFLKSLPEKEVKNGYAELLKMMIISHREFFTLDFDDIFKNINKYLLIAINSKVNICSNDLHDRGQRQILNLGHTFGHLFEVISNYEIPHGEAVSLGLVFALKQSLLFGLLSQGVHDTMLKYIHYFCNLPKLTPDYVERIYKDGQRILLSDKKTDKHIKLVLITEDSIIFRLVESLSFNELFS